MTTTYRANKCKAVLRQSSTLFTGLLLMIIFFSSCKKNTLYEGAPYSIKVFNAIDGGVNLYGNYNGSRPGKYKTSVPIQNRRTALNSYFSEENIHATYFAVPDTFAKDQPIFMQDFNLGTSMVNTLFLMGDKNNVDYLFSPLNFKRYTVGDSLSFLTFVNTSKNLPVSVNIRGKANGSLVNQLAYKNISDVIELPLGVIYKTYSLEFRDANTGDSLTSFIVDNANPGIGIFNTYLYKNTSLVLVGKRGGTGVDKMEVVRVDHH